MNGKPAILIQARIGASRLPGKVLMDIAGRPMISHVLERCRQVKSAGEIMVVTTTEAKDDPLADYLKKTGIHHFRGSETDVLERYYQAAKPLNAPAIVRITADCPLLDPDVTESVLQFFIDREGSIDYASNFVRRTYPRGLDTEIFSMQALDRAWRETKKPHEREHVTPYFYEQEGRFRTGSVTNDFDHSNLRWTVDEPKDLEFVRAVYQRLYQPGKIFGWKQTIDLLSREPGLTLINKEVQQKATHSV